MLSTKVLAVLLSLSLTMNSVIAVPLQLQLATDAPSGLQGNSELEDSDKSPPSVQSRLLCLLLLKPLLAGLGLASLLQGPQQFFPLNLGGTARPAGADPAAPAGAAPAPAGGAPAPGAPAAGEEKPAGEDGKKPEGDEAKEEDKKEDEKK